MPNGFGNATPKKVGCSTGKEEVMNSLSQITKLASGVTTPFRMIMLSFVSMALIQISQSQVFFLIPAKNKFNFFK
jgi:hypothetical protein